MSKLAQFDKGDPRRAAGKCLHGTQDNPLPEFTCPLMKEKLPG